MKKYLLIAISLITAIGAAVVIISTAKADTTIEFVAESGAVVGGDEVTVTGQPAGTTTLGDCAGDPTQEYPNQFGVSVGSGGTAPFQVAATIALTPGTKLTNISKILDCTIDGAPYEKFNGTLIN